MSNRSQSHYLFWLSLGGKKVDHELAPHGSTSGAWDTGSASPNVESRPTVLVPLHLLQGAFPELPLKENKPPAPHSQTSALFSSNNSEMWLKHKLKEQRD